jgi:hypothetical protein
MKPARDGPPVLVVAWLPGMLCSPFLLLCDPTLLVGIDLVSPGIRYRARSGRPHSVRPSPCAFARWEQVVQAGHCQWTNGLFLNRHKGSN